MKEKGKNQDGSDEIDIYRTRSNSLVSNEGSVSEVEGSDDKELNKSPLQNGLKVLGLGTLGGAVSYAITTGIEKAVTGELSAFALKAPSLDGFSSGVGEGLRDSLGTAATIYGAAFVAFVALLLVAASKAYQEYKQEEVVVELDSKRVSEVEIRNSETNFSNS